MLKDHVHNYVFLNNFRMMSKRTMKKPIFNKDIPISKETLIRQKKNIVKSNNIFQ